MIAELAVIPFPAEFRFQPIDADEAASRLVELTLGSPAGLAPDLEGLHIYEAVDLLRSYLKAVRMHRLLVSVRIPGAAARAIRAGANLAPHRALSGRT